MFSMAMSITGRQWLFVWHPCADLALTGWVAKGRLKPAALAEIFRGRPEEDWVPLVGAGCPRVVEGTGGAVLPSAAGAGPMLAPAASLSGAAAHVVESGGPGVCEQHVTLEKERQQCDL